MMILKDAISAIKNTNFRVFVTSESLGDVMDSKNSSVLIWSTEENKIPFTEKDEVYKYLNNIVNIGTYIISYGAGIDLMVSSKDSEFDVWIEGYRATGQSANATFCSKYKASNFNNACIAFLIENGSSLEYYDKTSNSYWGCRFFDNETDAKKSFG